MNTDFIKEIEIAEDKAAEIVKQAEKKAKNKIEYSKRQLNNKLETAREESELRFRSAKNQADEKARENLNQKLADISIPDLSLDKKNQAADRVLERIVDFLGNS